MHSDLTNITSNTLHSYVTNLMAKAFFIFALFPFVSFGTNSMDSQPHYIFLAIFSFILFATSGVIFKKSIHILIILSVVLLTLILMENNFDFTFIRGVGSYLGFFMTLIVSIIYFNRYGIPIKTIIFANLIYIFCGILQVFYGGLALDFLVVSNTDGASLKDGVMSLTSEHTFFGIVLYFFSWILLVTYDYNPPKIVKLLILVNILSIFLLAKSSMVILYLIITMFAYLLRYWNKRVILKKLLITLLLIVFSIYFFTEIIPLSRFTSLIYAGGSISEVGLFTKIFNVVGSDASINDRLLNVLFPYYGFVENNGFPGGLNSYNNMSHVLVDRFNGFFWSGLGSNKILSFTGAFLYELGAIGLFIFFYFYYFLKDRNNPNRFIEIALLFVILHSAIAVAFSLIPIFIAILYYKKMHSKLHL